VNGSRGNDRDNGKPRQDGRSQVRNDESQFTHGYQKDDLNR
jgi:hypothetical protein